jgi:hypothetical protein
VTHAEESKIVLLRNENKLPEGEYIRSFRNAMGTYII